MENNVSKMMERIGTVFGIAGAFLAALGVGVFGYPLFTVSSVCLMTSSYQQNNKNLFALQSAFLGCNIIGIYTFAFGS
jgi:hypothetical protein